MAAKAKGRSGGERARKRAKTDGRGKAEAKAKPPVRMDISETIAWLEENDGSGEALDETKAWGIVDGMYENVRIMSSQNAGGSTKASASARRNEVQALEQGSYLEKVLVPLISASILGQDQEDREKRLLLSSMRMVVEKSRQQVPLWRAFTDSGCTRERFDDFIKSCAKLLSAEELSPGALDESETTICLLFFTIAFRSLESEWVRGNLLRLVSLQLWSSLAPNRLERELSQNLKLKKYWNKILKREKKEKEQKGEAAHVPLEKKLAATFFPCLYAKAVKWMDGLDETDQDSAGASAQTRRENAEVFLQLVVELLSQLPTRRFVRTFLFNQGFLVRCKRSVAGASHLRTLSRLVTLVDDLMHFEVDDQDGSPISDEDNLALHYEYIQKLQRMAFQKVPKMDQFPLANCKKACQEGFLRKEVSKLDASEVKVFVTGHCTILDPRSDLAEDGEALVSMLVDALKVPTPRAKYLEMLPLYPTEATLVDQEGGWLESQGQGKLPTITGLPRMNLQFLTMRDYLVRNFKLLQLEAAHEISEDIKEVVPRMGAFLDEEDGVRFAGWARMASQVRSFRIVDVGPASLGEDKPSRVRAHVEIDLGSYRRQDIRNEWDAIKQHDVLFLLVARLQEPRGLSHVRGCEVVEIRDDKGKALNHFGFEAPAAEAASGSRRTLVVEMDSTQYHQDVLAKRDKAIYSSFNLLVRRGAKESNFKAVLECIRNLAKEDIALPPWLHDVFLGYGDPASSHFTSMPEDQALCVDFRDTFLDADHLKRSFPGWEITFAGSEATAKACFKITFKEPLARVEDEAPSPIVKLSPGKMVVEPYEPKGGQAKRNAVEFTPVQASAILSGMQRGLTMIVGPPGTGKTDVATQILELLYHNEPNQRILLITHSNQALNDLFMKIMNRNVPARYLLRLGMGEQELETDLEFSRLGRVNAMLERRLRLLAEVERLARSMGVADDYASTCETCSRFWLLHVLSRWEAFQDKCKKDKSVSVLKEAFPFGSYFGSESTDLFAPSSSWEEGMAAARGLFNKLRDVFKEIEECRPFELLHSQSDRLNYLMTKQAKIVAMTCTYAAMKRTDFVKLGLEFDSIVMEESAQVLDIETLIPMRLERDDGGASRLKRCILIGDHNQLPPVVKNLALRQASNLEQSLFTRLIRLGTPYIELNAQGRSRPSLADLYNWNYNDLGDLPCVSQSEYLVGNPGFKFDYQLINVEDYNGQGESAPAPHFIQNLGEAEFAVTLYQHMRLVGYPAHKITILTTYNGQKALIRDVVERRCAHFPLFGRPAKIETVDRFQGQQNDYVILSLVRTKAVGHLRDHRRLVVAMSRARLGLFVLARKALFAPCADLRPTFARLLERPTTLHVLPKETYGETEREAQAAVCESVPITMEELTKSVVNKVQAWEKEQKKA